MVISAAARRMGYDERHWTTEDGHRHVSVPTEVPVKWSIHRLASGLTYISGTYVIRRDHYVGSRYMYTVLRQGVELPLGGLYSRLKYAKERAVRNAEGRDVVNVA